MKVLVDTDVLIDLALDRQPHSDAATDLLDWLEKHPGTAFVAWHSVSNFYYLVAPTRGRKDTRLFLLDLTRFIAVAPTTTDGVRQAARLDLADFEGALQVAAALACQAEVIATRNVSDYRKSPVAAQSPLEVLSGLSGRGDSE